MKIQKYSGIFITGQGLETDIREIGHLEDNRRNLSLWSLRQSKEEVL